MGRRRVVILGAAGRDFQNFNVRYRDDESVEVVAFTATQIPKITDRRYPAGLAGALYPEGIPIYAEEDLEDLVRDHAIEEAIFSYSDVPFEHVGHIASRVLAAGARFVLLPDRETALTSAKPVVSVCATRTGSGKSQTSRYVARLLREQGRRVAAIRHPMPYGDLTAQAVQHFASAADLESANCTIEEREEYEPYIRLGLTIFAGVDYGAILEQAEAEADVILWDGGNNDTPFYRSDLHIVVLDPLRAGHETAYHPGMVNLLTADAFIINKVDHASPDQVAAIEEAARRWNPEAAVIRARSVIDVDRPEAVRGRRVLCVEDGPTLTHGEMDIGAAWVAASRLGAEIVDPRPWAVGSLAAAFEKYPRLGPVLPALGYYPRQLEELQETIAKAEVDAVLIGTPIDLARLVEIEHPTVRVTYHLEEVEGQATSLSALLDRLG